ncbi:unnamed protein product, partial [Urochloa humidicola]
ACRLRPQRPPPRLLHPASRLRPRQLLPPPSVPVPGSSGRPPLRASPPRFPMGFDAEHGERDRAAGELLQLQAAVALLAKHRKAAWIEEQRPSSARL